jgi:excisionase family DNA binding protein
MPTPQQLDFPSLAFPKDRTVLTVGEVAERWRVSVRHVLDLIEEGKLDAFDIAGQRDYFRVHMSVLAEISKQSGLPVETLLQIIRSARPTTSRGPSHFRVPVEGYNGFIRQNHSLALAGK